MNKIIQLCFKYEYKGVFENTQIFIQLISNRKQQLKEKC